MVTIFLHFHPPTFMFSPVLPLIPPAGISSSSLRPAHGDALCSGGYKDHGEAVSSWRAASSASLCLSISTHHSPLLLNPAVPWGKSLERSHRALAGARFLLQLVKDFLLKGSCEGNACYCKQIHPMGRCQFC